MFLVRHLGFHKVLSDGAHTCLLTHWRRHTLGGVGASGCWELRHEPDVWVTLLRGHAGHRLASISTPLVAPMSDPNSSGVRASGGPQHGHLGSGEAPLVLPSAPVWPFTLLCWPSCRTHPQPLSLSCGPQGATSSLREGRVQRVDVRPLLRGSCSFLFPLTGQR